VRLRSRCVRSGGDMRPSLALRTRGEMSNVQALGAGASKVPPEALAVMGVGDVLRSGEPRAMSSMACTSRRSSGVWSIGSARPCARTRASQSESMARFVYSPQTQSKTRERIANRGTGPILRRIGCARSFAACAAPRRLVDASLTASPARANRWLRKVSVLGSHFRRRGGIAESEGVNGTCAHMRMCRREAELQSLRRVLTCVTELKRSGR
jgi:hypothetical protein